MGNSDSYKNIKRSDKRSTFRSHRNADHLLKHSTSKFNKYVVNKKLQPTDHLFLCVTCFTFLLTMLKKNSGRIFILQITQIMQYIKTVKPLRNKIEVIMRLCGKYYGIIVK